MSALLALYSAALIGAALAAIVLSVVDIVRRPSGMPVLEAWVNNWSTGRVVAFVVFFCLFVLGMFLPGAQAIRAVGRL